MIDCRMTGFSGLQDCGRRPGLDIAYPPAELTILAPDGRLGLDMLRFDPKEMQVMFMQGRNAAPRALIP